MLMTTLNPSQIQVVNNFKSKPREEQAKMISDVCNEKGITKEQEALEIALRDYSDKSEIINIYNEILDFQKK